MLMSYVCFIMNCPAHAHCWTQNTRACLIAEVYGTLGCIILRDVSKRSNVKLSNVASQAFHHLRVTALKWAVYW